MSGKIEPKSHKEIDEALKEEWLRRALGLPEGQRPFPWQLELLERFLRGAAVQALDIPTGLGKTATMAIWLVARALGASLPRRLVYVVDRRAVVDQATEIAEHLREWVANEPPIAEALGLGDRRLPISTLRGQHVDNRQWLEDPSLPAIVLGTVDMVGSRLLFSGYGVSRKMRPYHAGLLGADALIVLDEAHLVQPFERLIEQLASGVDANGRTLGPAAPSERTWSPIRAVTTTRAPSTRASERRAASASASIARSAAARTIPGCSASWCGCSPAASEAPRARTGSGNARGEPRALGGREQA